MSRDLLSRPGALPLIMTSGPRWNTRCVDRNARASRGPGVLGDRCGGCRSVGPLLDPCGMHTSGPTDGNQRWIFVLSVSRWEGEDRASSGAVLVRTSLLSVEWRCGAACRPSGWERTLRSRRPFPLISTAFIVISGSDQTLVMWPFITMFRFLVIGDGFPPGLSSGSLFRWATPKQNSTFDALRKGERLRLSIAPEALDRWEILLTLYDRASFPMDSDAGDTTMLRDRRARGDRMCLIRVWLLFAGTGSILKRMGRNDCGGNA